MKTTMSTAVVSVGLVQQGSSAASSGGGDSGFSRVLSGVQSTQGVQNAQGGESRKAPSGSVRKEDASFTDFSGTASAETAGEMTVSETETGTALGEAAEVIGTAGKRPNEAEDPVSSKVIKTFSDMEYRAVSGSVESVSITLEEKLTQLVMILSEGDEDEEGKVIDALLEILRRMQQGEREKDGDEAVSLVMQMLMAMLGGQETDNAALQLSVQNVSEEMSVICGVYRQESTNSAFAQDAGAEENAVSSEGSASEETAQGDPSAQSALQAQEFAQTAEQPVVERTEETFAAEKPKFQIEPEELARPKTTEAVLPADEAQTEKPEAAQPNETETVRQTETLVQTQTLPQAQTLSQTEMLPQTQEQTLSQEQTLPRTAERLLSEILDKAREELGLTKAELIQTPERTEERTLSILPKTETETESPDGREAENGAQNPEPRTVNPTAKELALSPNHKDGRGELDRILSGRDEPNEKTDFTKQSPNAAIPQRAEIRQVETPRENEARTSAIPPERQLTDEILARSETFEGGRSEFTMVLNPESLGRITVRLISAGGRVQVSIAAENDATRQLLAAREDQIGSAMKTNGVELERYQVVSGREEAQLMQDNYDGSSKNPYGQQEERSEERTDDEEDFLEILQQL